MEISSRLLETPTALLFIGYFVKHLTIVFCNAAQNDVVYVIISNCFVAYVTVTYEKSHRILCKHTLNRARVGKKNYGGMV